MNWTSVWEFMVGIIPIAGFAAAIVSAVVYVRYKGTMDAMKETINTYERLAAGYKEEAEALRAEIATLEKKVAALESEIRAQSLAFEKLTEKFVDTLQRYGVRGDGG